MIDSFLYNYIGFFGAILAFSFAFKSFMVIYSYKIDIEKVREITSYIKEGAFAYISVQYKTITIVLFIIFTSLCFKTYCIDFLDLGSKSLYIPFSFLVGGFFSCMSGVVGMYVAVTSNGRACIAAKKSLNSSLNVSFNSGIVMGMTVVGFVLFNISFWMFVVGIDPANLKSSFVLINNILFSSCFGGSIVALFARVGGGVFTKAADIGADLVGKNEVNIPEDDARNPASIADNVGDNVGDIAGMGADLYESYMGSIVASIAMASYTFLNYDLNQYLMFVYLPIMLSVIGLISSIIGTYFVKSDNNSDSNKLLWVIRKGIYTSSFIFCFIAFIFIYCFVPFIGFRGIGIFCALVTGVVIGNLIGYFTEYYTDASYPPTQKVVNSAATGSATVVISGLAVGKASTIFPVFILSTGILASFSVCNGFGNFNMGLYGISIASVSMLSTLAITLATDAYGPVADNAGGIAEMAGLDESVRKTTDALDVLGNTTAATGKGFAIGSAAFTSLILLVSCYDNISQIIINSKDYSPEYVLSIMDINLIDPIVIVGLLVGAMLPFYFSSLTMDAVGRSAAAMVQEVRRQFNSISGIIEGTVKPDYAACVSISTKAALKEMVLPGLIAVLFPLIFGILLGVKGLLSLLVGAITSGTLLAIMMVNAGGAWDNSKKYIENGHCGGKGSAAHKASVVGDMIGDPFKDTSGPSINILIKLMIVVSMVFSSLVLLLNKILFASF